MFKPITITIGVNGRMANYTLPEDCFKKQFAYIRGAVNPASACEAEVVSAARNVKDSEIKKFVWQLAYLHALYQMRAELARELWKQEIREQEKGAENGNR